MFFFQLISRWCVSFVNEIRDLGVTFRNDLSFGKHIQLITASAFRKLGFINHREKYFKHANT